MGLEERSPLVIVPYVKTYHESAPVCGFGCRAQEPFLFMRRCCPPLMIRAYGIDSVKAVAFRMKAVFEFHTSP